MKHLLSFLLSLLIIQSLPATPLPEREERKTIDRIEDKTTVIQGKKVLYDMYKGHIPIKSRNKKIKADMGFIAYVAHNNTPHERPIAFCFNGGPGSSSIWLHMGLLGPKILQCTHNDPTSSITKKENHLSPLALTDLVFIDPIGTGFSRSEDPDKASTFYGVEEDLFSIAEFIRSFLTQFNRWQSPKVLIGESYGSFRAAGLAHILQDHFSIDTNALILISLALNIDSLETDHTFDLPCITRLPTYAAIAHYHHQNDIPLKKVIEESTRFAIEQYGPALSLGDRISQSHKEQIAEQLSQLIFLPKSLILDHHLRIEPNLFSSTILPDRAVGRYDGRITRWKSFEGDGYSNRSFYPDPSMYAYSATFTAAFQEYLAQDLNWKTTIPYIILNNRVSRLWNWDAPGGPDQGFGYASCQQTLRLAMAKNPKLKIFVAAGYYDLATPYLSQEHAISHLLLAKPLQKNITFKGYSGGHMMYLTPSIHAKLSDDMRIFIENLHPSS